MPMAATRRASDEPPGGAIRAQCVPALERLLSERCGYRFTDVQRRSLEDAIRRRMAVIELGPADYVHQVESSSPMTGELAALLAEFTNTETHFFRHEGRFQLLREQVVPALLRRRHTGSPLRILSAGCSSGEEVYSAIMSLLEIEDIWVHHGLEVVGCDINQRALDRAREATYGAWTLRYTPERYLQGYFRATDDTEKVWSVVERVRRHATFRRLNLVDDGLLAQPGMRDFDVVFCCNVMIYLTDDVVEQLMARLCGMLAPQGFLFVGYTESLHARRRDFEPIWSNDYVVYRRATAPVPTLESRPSRPRSAPTAPTRALQATAPRRRAEADSDPQRAAASPAAESTSGRTSTAATSAHVQRRYERALESCRNDRHDDAMRRVNQLLRDSPFHWRARLLKGYLHGSRGEFWQAVAECTKILDIDPVCAQAYLLLGLLLEQQGEVESAIRETKRAIFLDPDLPLAYFTLGKLHRSAGDGRAAARHFANTTRLLRTKPTTPVAPDIPVEYGPRLLMQLAERQLGQLGGG